MKITQQHYTFWLERRAPTPTWAKPVTEKRAHVSVHDLINVQSGERTDTVLHNTLNLIGMRLRAGDSPYVALRESHWDTHSYPRRGFMFARWRRKLVRSLERRGEKPVIRYQPGTLPHEMREQVA